MLDRLRGTAGWYSSSQQATETERETESGMETGINMNEVMAVWIGRSKPNLSSRYMDIFYDIFFPRSGSTHELSRIIAGLRYCLFDNVPNE